ncbi:MAG: phosphotriesterase [Chloroflexota bacterium]
MTVLGPIPSRDMGITLPHEHLQFDLFRITRDRNGRFNANDIPMLVDELAHFKQAGGRTLVELSNQGLSRDPEALKRIATASGINIIMGSGWYREPYYDHAYIRRASVRQIADDIVDEIEHGVGGSGARPGIIGEIGADLDYVSPAEERVFRASAKAHLRTGLTVTTHALESPVGLQQLDILQEAGMDPRRVIVGHCGTWMDLDYHEAIARRGAYVQFDTVRGTFPYDDVQIARAIRHLVRLGFLEHVLISHDCCYRTHLTAYGGNGYGHILRSFVPALLEAGLSREQVDTIIVENPRRAISGER